MKKIPLTQNKFALVDDDDYEFLMQWKWYYHGRYAARGKYLGCFTSEKQAAQAYNIAARELFGEFAKLNITEVSR